MRLALIAALAFAIDSMCAQSPTAATVDAATFRAVCGTCHSTSLVDGLRTEAEWREEIDQMVKIGARGTEEQMERVMRVLSRTLTKVNVNTADARQIAPVLDVTESVGEAIVSRRMAKGNYRTIDDLKQVPGVDSTKLEARKDRILF